MLRGVDSEQILDVYDERWKQQFGGWVIMKPWVASSMGEH